MPVILDTMDHLVVRRLAREELAALAEHLPQALGGEAQPWMDGDAWA
jgi:hypothetical protein